MQSVRTFASEIAIEQKYTYNVESVGDGLKDKK